MTVRPVVGRVHATASRPSTPHTFFVAAPPDAPLGVGAIVVVADGRRTVYGVVTDAAAWDEGPLAPGAGEEVRLYQAAVLRHVPDEPVQPVPLAEVALADDADVALALRMEGYTTGARPTGIPLGLYAAGGREVPVALDADFVLGPEAAHVNVSGVSGLATKTSALEALLAAVFQAFPAHKGSVAALCFNVKGPDLCFLDQPAELDDAERARWARLGLVPGPFPRVRYYAPPRPDGINLNTLRTHAALAHNTEPLVWGLREVVDFAEVVMNRDDVDARADAFLDFLAERVVGRAFPAPELRSAPFEVQSFADLEQFFRAIFDHVEGSGRGDLWRTHHVATIRKVRNRLGNISVRAKGLVTDDDAPNDLPWGRFADRTVYVVDVAGLDPLAQDLVFARTIAVLRDHLERRALGVDHVMVMVDELNKYAPADGPDTYVRRMLLDIAERGRYLGLVLLSAQQFRSQVLRRIPGNAGTQLIGRSDLEELGTAGYQTLGPALRARLAGLPRGELLLRHPHFTQPVFLRLPRPAVLTGREGVERFPPEPDLPFGEAIVRQLSALGAGPRERLLAAIDGRREADVRRALAATRRHRPDDPTAFFLAQLGRPVEAERAPAPRRAVRGVAGGDDPYGG